MNIRILVEGWEPIELRSDDPRVQEITRKIIPEFQTADFAQALSVVVLMFGMAICRCPSDLRIWLVHQLTEPILKVSADMARADG